MDNFSIWHILFLAAIAAAGAIKFALGRKSSSGTSSDDDDDDEQRRRRDRDSFRTNPATGLPMVSDTRDAGGNALASSSDLHH